MDISTQTPLNGAHVVVFGGSSGIGLATAVAAKAKGAIVTLIGRTPAKLEAAARTIGGAQTAIADIAERIYACMSAKNPLCVRDSCWPS